MCLDATYMDLCLEVFPWVKYRKSKGAIKIHVGLDHAGNLPSFVRVTDGKGSDIGSPGRCGCRPTASSRRTVCARASAG